MMQLELNGTFMTQCINFPTVDRRSIFAASYGLYDLNYANLLRSYRTTACRITDAPVAQSSAELNSSG